MNHFEYWHACVEDKQQHIRLFPKTYILLLSVCSLKSQNIFCNKLWWLSSRFQILICVSWSSSLLSKACCRIAVALQLITRGRADKWGVWLSGPRCYLGAAMYSRLLCRRWRQVTRREGGKGRTKGVRRGERGATEWQTRRHTEGGEDKKERG